MALELDLSGDDVRRRRTRTKNIVLALALLAFVVLVYMVSLVRMGTS